VSEHAQVRGQVRDVPARPGDLADRAALASVGATGKWRLATLWTAPAIAATALSVVGREAWAAAPFALTLAQATPFSATAIG
jgi:hypothetical protein